MKNSKNKIRIQYPLVNPIINLERMLDKVLRKGVYIVMKCHNTLCDNDSGSYEIKFSYYKGESPEEWLVLNYKLVKALNSQGNSTRPQRYAFTERLLIGEAKATFNLDALDIGIHTVDDFLAEMTKHTFPAYVFLQTKEVSM